MKKISTLFVVEYHKKGTPGIIHDRVREENMWVYTEDDVIATRKFDGTAIMIKSGIIYRRYDAKPGKSIPYNAIPCQDADPISGHHPHWILCNRNNTNDQYVFEAFDSKKDWEDGTYELCGPKIGNNAEQYAVHILVKHGSEIIPLPCNPSFETIKDTLSELDIEGIVFYGKDKKMCKIRKTDFGLMR